MAPKKEEQPREEIVDVLVAVNTEENESLELGDGKPNMVLEKRKRADLALEFRRKESKKLADKINQSESDSFEPLLNFRLNEGLDDEVNVRFTTALESVAPIVLTKLILDKSNIFTKYQLLNLVFFERKDRLSGLTGVEKQVVDLLIEFVAGGNGSSRSVLAKEWLEKRWPKVIDATNELLNQTELLMKRMMREVEVNGGVLDETVEKKEVNESGKSSDDKKGPKDVVVSKANDLTQSKGKETAKPNEDEDSFMDYVEDNPLQVASYALMGAVAVGGISFLGYQFYNYHWGEWSLKRRVESQVSATQDSRLENTNGNSWWKGLLSMEGFPMMLGTGATILGGTSVAAFLAGQLLGMPVVNKFLKEQGFDPNGNRFTDSLVDFVDGKLYRGLYTLIDGPDPLREAHEASAKFLGIDSLVLRDLGGLKIKNVLAEPLDKSLLGDLLKTDNDFLDSEKKLREFIEKYKNHAKDNENLTVDQFLAIPEVANVAQNDNLLNTPSEYPEVEANRLKDVERIEDFNQEMANVKQEILLGRWTPASKEKFGQRLAEVEQLYLEAKAARPNFYDRLKIAIAENFRVKLETDEFSETQLRELYKVTAQTVDQAKDLDESIDNVFEQTLEDMRSAYAIEPSDTLDETSKQKLIESVDTLSESYIMTVGQMENINRRYNESRLNDWENFDLYDDTLEAGSLAVSALGIVTGWGLVVDGYFTESDDGGIRFEYAIPGTILALGSTVAGVRSLMKEGKFVSALGSAIGWGPSKVWSGTKGAVKLGAQAVSPLGKHLLFSSDRLPKGVNAFDAFLEGKISVDAFGKYVKGGLTRASVGADVAFEGVTNMDVYSALTKTELEFGDPQKYKKIWDKLLEGAFSNINNAGRRWTYKTSSGKTGLELLQEINKPNSRDLAMWLFRHKDSKLVRGLFRQGATNVGRNLDDLDLFINAYNRAIDKAKFFELLDKDNGRLVKLLEESSGFRKSILAADDVVGSLTKTASELDELATKPGAVTKFLAKFRKVDEVIDVATETTAANKVADGTAEVLKVATVAEEVELKVLYKKYPTLFAGQKGQKVTAALIKQPKLRSIINIEEYGMVYNQSGEFGQDALLALAEDMKINLRLADELSQPKIVNTVSKIEKAGKGKIFVRSLGKLIDSANKIKKLPSVAKLATSAKFLGPFGAALSIAFNGFLLSSASDEWLELKAGPGANYIKSLGNPDTDYIMSLDNPDTSYVQSTRNNTEEFLKNYEKYMIFEMLCDASFAGVGVASLYGVGSTAVTVGGITSSVSAAGLATAGVVVLPLVFAGSYALDQAQKSMKDWSMTREDWQQVYKTDGSAFFDKFAELDSEKWKMVDVLTMSLDEVDTANVLVKQEMWAVMFAQSLVGERSTKLNELRGRFSDYALRYVDVKTNGTFDFDKEKIGELFREAMTYAEIMISQPVPEGFNEYRNINSRTIKQDELNVLTNLVNEYRNVKLESTLLTLQASEPMSSEAVSLFISEVMSFDNMDIVVAKNNMIKLLSEEAGLTDNELNKFEVFYSDKLVKLILEQLDEFGENLNPDKSLKTYFESARTSIKSFNDRLLWKLQAVEGQYDLTYWDDIPRYRLNEILLNEFGPNAMLDGSNDKKE